MKHGKHSVRVKMFVLCFASIFGTVALCILLNNTFLVRYYERSKQKTLGKAFEQVKEILMNDKRKQTGDASSENQAKQEIPTMKPEESADGKTEEEENGPEESSEESEQEKELSEETRLSMDILCSRLNTTVVVVKSLLSEGTPGVKVHYFFGPGGKNDKDVNVIRDMLGDYFFPGYGQELKNKRLETETEDYRIYSLYDQRMKSKFIELIGVMEDGDIVLMRTNVESMQESMAVANKFLVYVGILSALLASWIMYFVSKRFTGPILELSDIAKQMAELNFDVRYERHSQDEIGELGNSINVLSGTLEHTISELKSANNELQKDIEKKNRVEEMRTDFLSNVTHELKTPIALIQGYAEGLKDNINESAEDREFYCDVIMDEATKMNGMVKKLLTLNHLEFGATQVEMDRFDLTELVRSVLATTEILAKQKEVTVYFEQKEPVYVWADEYMVEEVLTNYISNAFHHVDGARIIEVKLIPMENRVRVAVFNTGETIPEEDCEKLWTKFYKVDKARTREYGGTGIGLSIVKAIMEAHHQGYGMKNHANGVEFWFELDSTVQNMK